MEKKNEMGQVGETADGNPAGGGERIFVFSLKPQPEEEKGIGAKREK